MNAKTIVVLGGGVGGIVVSNELRRRLPQNHKVVLVEKNAEHAFAPSFLWMMTGGRRPESITRSLKSLVRKGVEISLTEATNIDILNRSVTTSERTFQYDYLVIALGAELAPEVIPGLAQGAQSFYTFQETSALQKKLAQFNGGIGDGTAAVAAVGKDLLDIAHPAFELGVGIAGIGGGQTLPQRVALPGELAYVGGDELVLGTEMSVERHFVGCRGLGDGVDADGPDAVPIEQVARGGENAIAWRRLRRLGEWSGNGANHGLLTGVLPVSIQGLLPVSNIKPRVCHVYLLALQ